MKSLSSPSTAAVTVSTACIFALALMGSVALAATTDAPSTPAPAAPSPAASAPEPIHYANVAAARAALEAQDGVSTIVTHSDGWTIVSQPSAAAQWSFTPPDHAAYPAVVRRIIRRGANDAIAVETTSLCEGQPTACTALLREFEPLNERIVQSLRARSGQPHPTP